MRKIVSVLRRNAFLLSLLVLFVAVDAGVAAWDPVNTRPQFGKNDLAKIKQAHPEAVWPSVFWGNSIVIASFDETKSPSHTVNAGINYGKMTDLDAMLRKGMLPVTDTLYLGLNLFTFLDTLPTNPGYLWHKKAYEPYVYFYRSDLKEYLLANGKALLHGEPLNKEQQGLYYRDVYHGRLGPEELKAKKAEFDQKYAALNIQHDFQANLAATRDVMKYCQAHNIRVKVVWMPWNPTYPPPAYVDGVKDAANRIFESFGVKTYDWQNRYTAEYFHDLGHLNWESGAPKFTQDFEQNIVKGAGA
jgi:hypothetical protein